MKTKLLTATALCAAALFGAGAASAQATGYVTPKTTWGAFRSQTGCGGLAVTIGCRPG